MSQSIESYAYFYLGHPQGKWLNSGEIFEIFGKQLTKVCERFVSHSALTSNVSQIFVKHCKACLERLGSCHL